MAISDIYVYAYKEEEKHSQAFLLSRTKDN